VIVVNGIDKRQQRVETGAQTTSSKTMMTSALWSQGHDIVRTNSNAVDSTPC